jgi:hypothetical protein
MPTTVTRTIGSGRDHSTFSDWISWCASNYSSGLVAADVILRAEVYAEGGGTDGEWTASSTVMSPGLACDETRYYLVEAASGEGIAGNANKLTNELRYNRANGVAVAMTGNYTHFVNPGSSSVRMIVKGIQLKNTNGALLTSGNIGANIVFESCTLQSGRAAAIVSENTSAVNCIVIPTHASGYVQGGNAGSRYWRNCTIFGNGAANAFVFGTNGGNVIANTAVFGFASGVVNNTARINTSLSINVATDLASVGWTGGSGAHLTSLTASDQFENVGSGTEDFRAKASGSLDGAGARDQTFTGDLDIVGQSRSTTTPNIGVWENAPSAPTAPTGVTAGSITALSATCSWTDASSDETGFKVEYAPSPYSSWTALSGSPTAANATSLATGNVLAPGTTYKFRVASTNANGDSAWVESNEFTTVGVGSGRMLLLGVG